MNKQDFIKSLSGVEFSGGYNLGIARQTAIAHIVDQLKAQGAPDKDITVTDRAIEVGNQVFYIQSEKRYTGLVNVHSTYITIDGLRITKKDIIPTNAGFKTVNGAEFTRM